MSGQRRVRVRSELWAVVRKELVGDEQPVFVLGVLAGLALLSSAVMGFASLWVSVLGGPAWLITTAQCVWALSGVTLLAFFTWPWHGEADK